MIKALTRICKVLLATLMVMASLPVSATEMVCIIGPQRVAVPLAKCGMPCCAHGAMGMKSCVDAAKTSSIPKCCRKEQGPTAREAAGSRLTAGGYCRCETRLSISANPTFVWGKTVAFHVQAAVAIQAMPIELAPTLVAYGSSPIFGSDSSPPAKPDVSRCESRAPPELLVV